eukprot:SAG25_NODE_265_length_10686_cov_15.394163_5_plen_147_part_00
MLRKVSMTGVISVYKSGSLFQLVVGITISVFSLSLSAWCRPYKSPVANAFKLATEISILLTLILCTLLKFPEKSLAMEGLDEDFVGICLLLQTLIIPTAVLALSLTFLTVEAKEVIGDHSPTTREENESGDKSRHYGNPILEREHS